MCADFFYYIYSVLAVIVFIVIIKFTAYERYYEKLGGYRALQNQYLLVYGFAVAGDWLQGSHMYALYESYGLEKHTIEKLFITGHASSLVFGTIVGSLADSYGRRLNVIAYGLIYACSCIAMHSNSFWVLMLGRICGGIGASILQCAFESWLVTEHRKHRHSTESLGSLFSVASELSSIIAIIAGLTAQIIGTKFAYVYIYDVSFVFLVCTGILALIIWPENYGDTQTGGYGPWNATFKFIRQDFAALIIGLTQGMVEAAMYMFILVWTPILSQAEGKWSLPYGVMFSAFMISIAIGSALFQKASEVISITKIMSIATLIGSAALYFPTITPNQPYFIFTSFAVYEISIGIFWPCLSCLRSKYIPDDIRATVISFFRILTNLLVMLVFWQDINHEHILVLASSLVFAGFVQTTLYFAIASFFDKSKVEAKKEYLISRS